MFFFKIRNLKFLTAVAEAEAAKADEILTKMSFLPHRAWPVQIYREGSRWLCMLQHHPDPLQCVIAYGDSPAQACENFDALWNAPTEMDFEMPPDFYEEEEEF